jgi:type I restriction enzyme R subunit
MSSTLNEADVEQIAINLFQELGYTHLYGLDIAPDSANPERDFYTDCHLQQRLINSLSYLNPLIPIGAIEDAAKKLTRSVSPTLIGQNHAIHRMLIDGIDVTYRKGDRIINDKVMVIDFDKPEKNDWLIVNQFTIIENGNNRRPDLLVFLNGLPISIFELKNPAEEKADIWKAYSQIQTYKDQIPTLFGYNCLIALTDGIEARLGSLNADKERFSVWKTIDGEELAPTTMTQMEVLIKGVFNKQRLLNLIKYFIVFQADGKGSFIKILAAYHQYHAVGSAVNETIKASRPKGDKRIGVVWHTTGSGKSLSMVFYSGSIVLNPAMENPTIVVITDRNDLDQQLYNTFSDCSELLRQTPVQAESRDHLQELLKVASGGVVFTTVQKFMPEERLGQYPMLSDRRNIVVIADEAHRSQYDFIDGFARHMHPEIPDHL